MREMPSRQETRVGVKGDPTPDAEYGDDPERPSGFDSSGKFVIKCQDCMNQREVTEEEFESINSCMVMKFEEGIGEVPCGGEFERAEEGGN